MIDGIDLEKIPSLVRETIVTRREHKLLLEYIEEFGQTGPLSNAVSEALKKVSLKEDDPLPTPEEHEAMVEENAGQPFEKRKKVRKPKKGAP